MSPRITHCCWRRKNQCGPHVEFRAGVRCQYMVTDVDKLARTQEAHAAIEDREKRWHIYYLELLRCIRRTFLHA